MKLRPSAVQVEEPASGCDINTIARDTIIEFILRPRAGSLTCSVNGSKPETDNNGRTLNFFLKQTAH